MADRTWCTNELITQVTFSAFMFTGNMDEYAKQVLIHKQFDESEEASRVFGRPLRKYPRQEAANLLANNVPGYTLAGLFTYRDKDGCPQHFVIYAKHVDMGNTIRQPMCRTTGKGDYDYHLKLPKYPNGLPAYGLHDALIDRRARLLLVENEQEAEALNILGIPAVTCMESWMHWTSWDDIFEQEEEVILWTGKSVADREFAREATHYLGKKFYRLKRINPAAGNPQDWIRAFRERNDRNPTLEDTYELPILRRK